MMTAVEGMYGGLNTLAELLQIDRIGPVHQAGSDSLLTAQTFFSLVTKHLAGICDDTKFRGELFGLGTNHTKYKAKNYVNSSNGGSITNPIQNANLLASPPLQYYGNIHYPTQQAVHHGVGGYGGYAEDYQEGY